MTAALKRNWKWFVPVILLLGIPLVVWLLMVSRMNLAFLDLAKASPKAVQSYQFRADRYHVMRLPEGRVYQFDKSYDEMRELIAKELKEKKGWMVAGDTKYCQFHTGPLENDVDDAPAVVVRPQKDNKGSEVFVYLPPTNLKKRMEVWQGQERQWQTISDPAQ